MKRIKKSKSSSPIFFHRLRILYSIRAIRSTQDTIWASSSWSLLFYVHTFPRTFPSPHDVVPCRCRRIVSPLNLPNRVCPIHSKNQPHLLSLPKKKSQIKSPNFYTKSYD